MRSEYKNSVLWALVIDLCVGEPPAAIHPTVAMGSFITRTRPRVRRRPEHELLHGAGIVANGMLSSASFAWGATHLTQRMPRFIRGFTQGVALKPTFSLRSLLSAARSIERALRRDDLSEARRLLAWHLVSRDTSSLSAEEIAGAAIESIAENLSDSVIAPLLMYRVGGLPAAYVYRFVNTADAMLGYRTPELEWLGKCAARMDDVLNFVPARLAAVCIALAAPVGGGSPNNAFRIAKQYAHRTASPNAGWPMAAMAGAIDCRLTKRGHYVLHDRGHEPSARALMRARRIVAAAAAIGVWCLR